MTLLPITCVIPTLNRSEVLRRTLESLRQQCDLPAELIVIDGSRDDQTRLTLEEWSASVSPECQLIWRRADRLGSAIQRSQGVALASQPFIWFFDDDIVFEPECLHRLWDAIQSDKRIGGVNAMITNQRYLPPGRVTRTLFRLLDGQSRASYAGRCIGPAMNILPEDRDDLPEVVPVQWLNTTCTLYRREALPDPPFDSHFEGYSLLEDVALSLTVAKKWKLANARTARIYHDSQPSAFKNDQYALAKMELANRHYIMTRILDRTRPSDYLKLALLEVFGIVTSLVRLRGWKLLPAVLLGKCRGVGSMLGRRRTGTRDTKDARGNEPLESAAIR